MEHGADTNCKMPLIEVQEKRQTAPELPVMEYSKNKAANGIASRELAFGSRVDIAWPPFC